MRIDDKLFDQLATLARLEFGEDEKEKLKGDLERIVTWVEQLQQCDVTGTAPQLHMAEANNLLREDVPASPMPNEDALASAHHTQPPYFKVPKFINR